MSSTRRVWLATPSPLRRPTFSLLSLAGLAAFAGCQRVLPPPTERLNTAPVVIDEAMQRRDFSRSTAYYANGVTVAGPTGHYFEPSPKLPPTVQALEEPALSLAEYALYPFDLIWDPPWEDVAYPRAQAPASFTQSPPSDVTY